MARKSVLSSYQNRQYQADLRKQHVGDIYERYNAQAAGYPNQAYSDDGPYLRYIRRLTDHGWPQLRYLADFMDKAFVPYKLGNEFKKDLTNTESLERQYRTAVSVIDLHRKGRSHVHELNSQPELIDFLSQPWQEDTASARLLIVKDLSSQVIETLGAHYDIDPHFFRGQMADFVWYNIADQWIETPASRSRVLQNNFQHLRYIQPRYFSDKQSAKQAESEVRMFNVRRKFALERDQRTEWADSTHSECALIGASAAIWIRPNRNQHRGWLGIILMDPVIKEGYPLWGGYANLRCPPSMHDEVKRSMQLSWTPGRQDLITWIRLLWETSLVVREDQNYLTSPLYELVATQYFLLFELIKTRLSQTEYELEEKTKRSWNRVLSKMYPWRRQLPICKARIEAILESLRDQYGTAPHWKPTIETYEQALNINDELISRANGILQTVTAAINIEEAQNARLDAQDVSRITYLAFIFVPLSFVSGFLSMNTEFSERNVTVYWVYFAIAIPLSCLAVIIAVKWSAMAKLWEDFVERWKKKREDSERKRKESAKLSERSRSESRRSRRDLVVDEYHNVI